MGAFLAQADAGKDLRTSSYPSEYRGLEIKVSFGQGTFSKIPWIAFLTGEQQVSNGIYPFSGMALKRFEFFRTKRQ